MQWAESEWTYPPQFTPFPEKIYILGMSVFPNMFSLCFVYMLLLLFFKWPPVLLLACQKSTLQGAFHTVFGQGSAMGLKSKTGNRATWPPMNLDLSISVYFQSTLTMLSPFTFTPLSRRSYPEKLGLSALLKGALTDFSCSWLWDFEPATFRFPAQHS